MIILVKIHNYFFDEDEFIPDKDRGGETRRSLNGKAHTTVIGKSNKFMRFEVTINGMKTEQLKYIYEIEDYLYDENNESIEFIDPDGNNYNIIIPLPLEDSISVSGTNNNYNVTLTLEEIGGE